MKKEKIVRYSTEELRNLERNGGDRTDWNRVRRMKDKDIVYDKDNTELTSYQQTAKPADGHPG